MHIRKIVSELIEDYTGEKHLGQIGRGKLPLMEIGKRHNRHIKWRLGKWSAEDGQIKSAESTIMSAPLHHYFFRHPFGFYDLCNVHKQSNIALIHNLFLIAFLIFR
jgi:hypothetical protein